MQKVSKSNIIKITLCGPGDVDKEIQIAREVIGEWNQKNWESTGWGLKDQHWNTDAIPTMAERGQAAINHQLIDDSELIVAILWTRLGTPTGLAESGTTEEITRAIAREIHVLPYFSDLEAHGIPLNKNQARKLAAFRSKMMKAGLAFNFKSRKKFRDILETHLDAAVRKILLEKTKARKPHKTRPSAKKITQKAEGTGNIQSVGDGNTFNIQGSAKRPKVTIERLPDHISAEDQKQVKDWIEELVEASSGKTRSDLFAEWRIRFCNRFKTSSIPELKTGQMADVESWYRQHLNMTKADRKTTDPQSWRNGKYGAIKSKMKKMGRTELDYYPELSDRLNMKKPFISLTKVSKHDLGRVDGMVKRDYDKWRRQ